jgi:hypothetical protein
MPFNAISKPAATPGPTTAASVDACLTHARANASDGDVYQDTSTKALYIFWKPAGTTGWLVPGSIYGQIASIMSNASGEAYITLADDEDTDSDLTNRGWVPTPSHVPSKVGGSPLVLDSSAVNNEYEQIVFTPAAGTATTADVLVVAKIEFDTLPAAYDLGPTIDVRDGARKRQFCSPDNSSAGEINWRASAGIGSTNIDVGTSVAWIWSIHAGSTTALSSVHVDDRTNVATATYTDFLTTSNNMMHLTSYNSGGLTEQCVLKVYELAVAILS